MSDTARQDWQTLEQILNAATPQLASKQGIDFTRHIIVTDKISDVSIQRQTVHIHPDYATEGNPVERCLHILELCHDFDTRKDRWRQQHITEIRTRLIEDMRKLAVLTNNETVMATVEEALEW